MRHTDRDRSGNSGAHTSAPVASPTPSIGTGGGALRGIDEKLGANAFTGTSTLTVPLPISPGRNGARPDLALSYDSGDPARGWTVRADLATGGAPRDVGVLVRYQLA